MASGRDMRGSRLELTVRREGVSTTPQQKVKDAFKDKGSVNKESQDDDVIWRDFLNAIEILKVFLIEKFDKRGKIVLNVNGDECDFVFDRHDYEDFKAIFNGHTEDGYNFEQQLELVLLQLSMIFNIKGQLTIYRELKEEKTEVIMHREFEPKTLFRVVNSLIAQYTQLQKRISQLLDEKKKMEQKFEEERKEVRKTEEHILELISKLTTDSASMPKDAKSNLVSWGQRGELAIKVVKSYIESLQEQIKSLRAERALKDDEVRVMSAKVDKVEQTLTLLQRKGDGGEDRRRLEDLMRTNSELETRIRQWSDACERSKKEQEWFKTELQNKKHELETLQQQLWGVTAEVEDFKKKFGHPKASFMDIVNELEAARNRNGEAIRFQVSEIKRLKQENKMYRQAKEELFKRLSWYERQLKAEQPDCLILSSLIGGYVPLYVLNVEPGYIPFYEMELGRHVQVAVNETGQIIPSSALELSGLKEGFAPIRGFDGVWRQCDQKYVEQVQSEMLARVLPFIAPPVMPFGSVAMQGAGTLASPTAGVSEGPIPSSRPGLGSP